MKDFCYTINGERWVYINGKHFQDSIPFHFALKGVRTTKAELYLLSVGFSREDAREFLDSLPESGSKIVSTY